MFSLLVLAILVLPLALAVPALAVPPTTEVSVENDSFDDTDLCGFPITFTDSGTFKTTTFYDRAGNEVKSILTNYRDRFIETATANGKTLTTNYPTVFITAFPSEDFVSHGLRAAYHAPGAGLLLLDAGSVKFDAAGDVLLEVGPHQLIDGPVDAFCAYFAS